MNFGRKKKGKKNFNFNKKKKSKKNNLNVTQHTTKNDNNSKNNTSKKPEKIIIPSPLKISFTATLASKDDHAPKPILTIDVKSDQNPKTYADEKNDPSPLVMRIPRYPSLPPCSRESNLIADIHSMLCRAHSTKNVPHTPKLFVRDTKRVTSLFLSIILLYIEYKKELNAVLLNFTCDSQLDVANEATNMRNIIKKFENNVFSLLELEKTLEAAKAHILQISTHGYHDYKSRIAKEQFHISFQERHSFHALIDDDPEYSAYYAAVALIIEEEMLNYIDYAIINRNKNTIEPIYIPYDDFFRHDKIYRMLESIAFRHGCELEIEGVENKSFIKISRSIMYDMHGRYIEPNQLPLGFQLRDMMTRDKTVQLVYKHILHGYHDQIRKYPVKIYRNLKYSWPTLLPEIHLLFISNEIYDALDEKTEEENEEMNEDDEKHESEDEFTDSDEFTDDSDSDDNQSPEYVSPFPHPCG